jgi:hypothetical protein
MASTTARTGDAILRAYANLKAIRDNLPDRFVYQQEFYTMFNEALEELQQAGVDVSEWRLRPDGLGNTHATAFRAKIDAILTYFSIRQEKTRIGFQR